MIHNWVMWCERVPLNFARRTLSVFIDGLNSIVRIEIIS